MGWRRLAAPSVSPLPKAGNLGGNQTGSSEGEYYAQCQPVTQAAKRTFFPPFLIVLGRSLAQDRKKHAKTVVESGQGDRGDQKRRKG